MLRFSVFEWIHIMSEPTYPADALSSPSPVLSVAPVVLPAPGRAVDLAVRVSAPVTGSDLPVILLSHGQGYSNNLSSMNGYAPSPISGRHTASS